MGDDFRIAAWLIQPRLNAVSCKGTTVHLEPKVMEVLACLARHQGEPVSKEELLQTVWPNTFVTDDVLKRSISELRRVFEDDARESRIIQTIPKRGYRVLVPVEPINGEQSGSPARQSRESKKLVRNLRMLALLSGGAAVLLLILWGSLSPRNPLLGKAAALQIHSIAVLPLQNLSGDPSQEYFSDGMTDALITELAQIGGVRVISRTSSMQYKQTKKSLREIAQELNVDGIVEGTVQRSRERVRVSAQLIYGPADKHIWAKSYDRELRDALQLQAEVTRDIAQNISANVASLSGQHPPRAHPLNVEAYDDFLKGRNYVSRQTKHDVSQGKELLERSIHLDPNFAPAYGSLANAYYVMAAVNHYPQSESIEKSESAARKALSLDGNLAEAHCLLGLIYSMHDWHWAAAEKEFRQAIQSDPSSSFAHSQFAFYLVTVGRKAEALQEINTALELDPFSPVQHSAASFVFLYAREYEEAMREAHRAVEIDPGFSLGHLVLGSALHAEGKPEEAFPELLRYLSLSGQSSLAEELEMAARSKPGPGDPFQKAAPVFLRTYQKKQEMRAWAVNIAWAFMYLGDKDKAFEWLNRACDEHSMEVYAIVVDPDFDPLRSDPRFEVILQRIGLPL